MLAAHCALFTFAVAVLGAVDDVAAKRCTMDSTGDTSGDGEMYTVRMERGQRVYKVHPGNLSVCPAKRPAVGLFIKACDSEGPPFANAAEGVVVRQSSLMTEAIVMVVIYCKQAAARSRYMSLDSSFQEHALLNYEAPRSKSRAYDSLELDVARANDAYKESPLDQDGYSYRLTKYSDGSFDELYQPHVDG